MAKIKKRNYRYRVASSKDQHEQRVIRKRDRKASWKISDINFGNTVHTNSAIDTILRHDSKGKKIEDICDFCGEFVKSAVNSQGKSNSHID